MSWAECPVRPDSRHDWRQRWEFDHEPEMPIPSGFYCTGCLRLLVGDEPGLWFFDNEPAHPKAAS